MEPVVAYDPEERISRKDSARLARRSEDTIRRLERKHGLVTERDPDSLQVTYRVQDLIDRGILQLEDVATAGSAAESAELAGARETNAHLRAEIAERDGRLSYAEDLIKELKEHLSVKDKQLTQQSTQINKLTDALGGLSAQHWRAGA